MKRNQLIFLIISIAILSVSATLLTFSFYKVKYIRTIPMDIKISDYIGINIDDDALHFGTVSAGGCSDRYIILKHDYDYPVEVIIGVVGELEPWTSIEENQFTLEQDEEREVIFKVCPTSGTKGQTYTSTARIVFKRI